MSVRNPEQFERLAGVVSYLDSPAAGASVYDQCLPISGWLFAPNRDPVGCRVRGWCDGTVIGETRLLFVRTDVSRALKIGATIPTGFRFLANAGGAGEDARDAEIVVTGSWPNESSEYQIASVAVRLTPASLSQRPHGDVVHPGQQTVLHRDNIYGSGPPVSDPGAETLQLIRDYLPPSGSVVDVGCGAGAYGPPLIAAGYNWLGVETSAHCLGVLSERKLPHRAAEEQTGALPCAPAEFESAICIEVLEHVERADAFLSEIARAVRSRALFSVPNMEVLPYFSTWQVVPWHLLEADHKNFFTRTSLRELLRRHFRHVEVFSYAEHPLRTPDGIPLHVHLFAIADK